MSFTLDTNILIGLSQRYPRDIFESVWKSVEESVADGQICICPAVLHEVYRGGDALYDWAKNVPRFVCDVTQDELLTVSEIAIAHPGWVRDQTNEADPFVIAHAKSKGFTIVTEESRKGPNTEDRNQKIPNVADEHDVTCIKFFDFIRDQGWTF